MKVFLKKIVVGIILIIIAIIFIVVVFGLLPIIILAFIIWRIIRLTFFTSKQQRSAEVNGAPFSVQNREEKQPTNYIDGDIIDVEASVIDEKDISN